MYLNKVIICGDVCDQPELRHTKTNVPVTNFTIKTIDEWINRQNSEQRLNTKYHKIVCWGNTAKEAAADISKGQLVLIEGELSYHKQEDGSVQTEIKATNVQIQSESSQSTTEELGSIDGEIL